MTRLEYGNGLTRKQKFGESEHGTD